MILKFENVTILEKRIEFRKLENADPNKCWA